MRTLRVGTTAVIVPADEDQPEQDPGERIDQKRSQSPERPEGPERSQSPERPEGPERSHSPSKAGLTNVLVSAAMGLLFGGVARLGLFPVPGGAEARASTRHLDRSETTPRRGPQRPA